ncbi:hypothetical protein GCM10020221_13960 [Streptomyces thioluteus]|uniref:Cob(I)yrinic acid a,c-diamide adenosyltransferase n=1 Tax=Streptomyces thioluteus TaxID=66431 RepID=A0ABN3WMD3_STRTU
MFQFVKSAKWKVGRGAGAEGARGFRRGRGTVAWHKMGEGWSWVQRDISSSEEAAREGWEQVKRDLAAESYRLYVLDEFAYPLHWGWIDNHAEVISVLRDRPGTQHVVITGRNAPQELVDFADLVTDMSKVKHPMDTGQKGQRGIEW